MGDIFKWLSVACAAGAIAARRRAKQIEKEEGFPPMGFFECLTAINPEGWERHKRWFDGVRAERRVKGK